MITYQNSVVLADKLRELSPAINGVELFGSVLSKRYGRDADFLILVDDELAKHWWSKERESIRVRWPDVLYEQRWIIKKFIPFVYAAAVHKRRDKRLKFSASILNIELENLADSTGKVPDFEMFLVPVGWRIGKEVNMNLMQKITDLIHDPNTVGFLKRVAKDATRVA